MKSGGFLLRALSGQIPLEELRQEAFELKRKRFGERITFVHNRNINYTNHCINSCLFCAFSKRHGERGGYILTTDDILKRVLELPNITEVCIQGGLNPALNFYYYLDILKEIKRARPDIHIHAFSPQEIVFIAENSRVKIETVLETFKRYGLDSMPGTAAEILVDEVRQRLCPDKISTQEWVSTIKAAHAKGIPTTATIMFGHIESARDIARHFEIIYEIQQESDGFTEFVPLPYMPYRTRLGGEPVALDKVLRLTSCARIYFDQLLPHIQVSWVKLGMEGALRALEFGVDDIGGTLYEENITRSAGGRYGEALDLEYLRSRGVCLVERTTLYNIVTSEKMGSTGDKNGAVGLSDNW